MILSALAGQLQKGLADFALLLLVPMDEAKSAGSIC